MSKRCCAKNCFNSQLTNNRISYLGFPKNRQFANEWAKNASRPDICDKPIESITKYFLCSEHFTNECFHDPPQNTKLKKSFLNKCLVFVPSPTVFQNNLEVCVKETKVFTIKDPFDFVLQDEYYSYANENKRPKIASICESEVHDEQDNFLIHTLHFKADEDGEVKGILVEDDLFPKDKLEELIKANNLNTTDDSDSQEQIENYGEVNEEKQVEEAYECAAIIVKICRLCTQCYTEDSIMHEIFTEPALALGLNRLLPDMISENDGLPQSICQICFEKVNSIMSILNGFMLVQEKFNQGTESIIN